MAKTGSPPRWLKHVNKVIILMNRLGLTIENGAVLTVAGRRTGAPRRVPVSVMRWEGQRYLLAGYPNAEWPRNVRAAGGAATLSVARRVESVRLSELDAAAAEPILRAWPARIPKGAKDHAGRRGGAGRHAGVVRSARGPVRGVPHRGGVTDHPAHRARARA